MRNLLILLFLLFVTDIILPGCPVRAEDQSAPAMLQIFEATWRTIDDRTVDVFSSGYGSMWLPPPSLADTGGFSVGYDVFNRFDLGNVQQRTLYGTESGLKGLVETAHAANVRVYTDMILNHNGFRDNTTPGFQAEGDYPGFVLSVPNDPDGDFHNRSATGEEFFRLAGLIDIAQEKNYQFIRQPVDPGNPLNIPEGSSYDQPDPSNAGYYPDQQLGGTAVFDPRLNTNVTLYDFNTADPLQGDAISENATGLLMRHMRWMIQTVGVDGFRLDAARHMPRWMLDYVDQAVFRSKTQPLLDGSQDHPFIFSETGYDTPAFQQSFIRKDIDPDNLTVVGGNRDALDFNLFGAMRGNLTSNGLQNDWRNVKFASIDGNDDGFHNNGSQGVAFARSHDELGAYLDNVAHAYVLMRPGQALVYMNAKEFGNGREFPRGGRDDALGGFYGDTITTLVDIRNTHGRGNYLDRTPAADAKELLVFERDKSAVVALNNRLDGGFDNRTVQTSFLPGTPLIELTGNAANPLVDPTNTIPEVVTVDASGRINIKVPRNLNVNGVEHGMGYVVYGVSGPQGDLRFTDDMGADLTILPGDTPSSTNFGTQRLSDVTVVTEDSFRVRLETDAVSLPGNVRDRQADGDYAILKLNSGMDLNGNGSVDHVTPNSVSYGFEEFTEINQPGFFDPTGAGVYQQTISASDLPEGMHYITARAFRHRDPNTMTGGDPSTAGDGGPSVFTDFRQAIYVDRLPPESEVFSFESFSSLQVQRDLVARSVDGTADSMHIFLNLPAVRTDAQILSMVNAGQGQAGRLDTDLFVYGYNLVPSGNNVAVLVTFEITGNYSIQRIPGLLVSTERGLGIGDINFDNQYTPADIGPGPVSFEDVLYSQNTKFNPAADANGDGSVDTLDLFQLKNFLVPAAVSQATLDALRDLVLRRGDLNSSGATDVADIDWLQANRGATSDWLLDLNVDGVVNDLDLTLLIEEVFGTLAGDANLDGSVDGEDFVIWNSHKFTSGNGWADGDFNGDSIVDGVDFTIWNSNKFQQGSGGNPYNYQPPVAVPEPSSFVTCCLLVALAHRRRLAWRLAEELRKIQDGILPRGFGGIPAGGAGWIPAGGAGWIPAGGAGWIPAGGAGWIPAGGLVGFSPGGLVGFRRGVWLDSRPGGWLDSRPGGLVGFPPGGLVGFPPGGLVGFSPGGAGWIPAGGSGGMPPR